jgi:hypothetical protein
MDALSEATHAREPNFEPLDLPGSKSFELGADLEDADLLAEVPSAAPTDPAFCLACVFPRP